MDNLKPTSQKGRGREKSQHVPYCAELSYNNNNKMTGTMMTVSMQEYIKDYIICVCLLS